MMIIADVETRDISRRVITGASLDRGGLFITAGSTGSTPKDWAGGPSMRISRDWGQRCNQTSIRNWKLLTYPQNLHGIQGIFQTYRSTNEDQGQSSDAGAELEGDEVLNIVKNAFALLDSTQDR